MSEVIISYLRPCLILLYTRVPGSHGNIITSVLMYVSARLKGRTAREIQLQSNYVINSVRRDDFGSNKSGAQVCGLFNKESRLLNSPPSAQTSTSTAA